MLVCAATPLRNGHQHEAAKRKRMKYLPAHWLAGAADVTPGQPIISLLVTSRVCSEQVKAVVRVLSVPPHSSMHLVLISFVFIYVTTLWSL